MFIEIEKAVFDRIELIRDVYDPTIIAVDELFESMIKGKHIVYCTRTSLRKIENTVLSERVKQYAKWLLKEYVKIYSCKNIVKSYIVVSATVENISYTEEKILCPIDKFQDIDATKLLTENESDATLFLYISKYILKIRKISSLYRLSFENDAYHGANGSFKIEQLMYNNKIVLCIVDTDKDYPNDSRKATFRNVNDAVKKAKKNIPIELFQLPVREKENLFPAEVYCCFTDCKVIHVIADSFSNNVAINNFFDIKDGVKKKQISKADEKWNNYYAALMMECKKRNVCNKELAECKEDEVYISGIGSKLCDSVGYALFDETLDDLEYKFSNFTKDKLEDIKTGRNNILEQIPSFVIDNWTDIAKVLFTWGCALEKKRFPSIRTWE